MLEIVVPIVGIIAGLKVRHDMMKRLDECTEELKRVSRKRKSRA